MSGFEQNFIRTVTRKCKKMKSKLLSASAAATLLLFLIMLALPSILLLMLLRVSPLNLVSGDHARRMLRYWPADTSTPIPNTGMHTGG
ncbi:hypothetical protein Ancab_008225 [Ancistrocladus abbreviatus]